MEVMEVRPLRWKLTAAQLLANLTGALLAYSYFAVIDHMALPRSQSLSVGAIAFFVVGFGFLAAVGTVPVVGLPPHIDSAMEDLGSVRVRVNRARRLLA